MIHLPRLEEIFLAALQRPTEGRSAFLDGACEGDAELRDRAAKMLAAHDDAGSFLESPPSAVMIEDQEPTTAFRPVPEGPGTRIGPYKLLQQIGEGGFGVVYMAEQQEPVRRKV